MTWLLACLLDLPDARALMRRRMELLAVLAYIRLVRGMMTVRRWIARSTTAMSLRRRTGK